MYLIYQDEKGIKVAREDGRLDEYTKYYLLGLESATRFLTEFNKIFKIVEFDVSML